MTPRQVSTSDSRQAGDEVPQAIRAVLCTPCWPYDPHGQRTIACECAARRPDPPPSARPDPAYDRNQKIWQERRMVSLQMCAVDIAALALAILVVAVAVVVAVVDGHVVVAAFLVVVVAARGTLQLHQHHEWHQLPIELD